MEKNTLSSFLWIVVTVIIMFSLVALASPFGVYIRNNIETFTGDYIEKSDKTYEDTETPVCNLTIKYSVPTEAGTTLPSVHKTLKKNEQYNVVSPEIIGYEPNIEIVSGVITDEDTIITVTYSLGKYSIRFVMNEGNWKTGAYNPPEIYTYKSTTTLPTASDIYKENYVFAGWYETKDFSTNKITTITSSDYGDKVYYAKWEPQKYKITYVMNDSSNEPAKWGNAVSTNGTLKEEYQYYSYGTSMQLPTDINRFGFTFAGWSTEQTGTDKSAYRTQMTESDTGAITLYAQWTRNVYEITYHLTFTRPNGTVAKFTILDTEYEVIGIDGIKRTMSGIPTSYTYGETIILPNNLYYPGYQGNTKSEVWFNKETQKITISGGVVSYSPNAENTLIQKLQVSPAIVGFNKDNTTSSMYDHTDLDLYVKPIPNTYYIKFDSNAPTTASFMKGSMSNQAILYDEATALKACAYSCSGYKFIGWNTQPNGTGSAYIMYGSTLKEVVNIGDKQKIYNMTTEHQEVITLYAQWEPINTKVTINYYYQNINDNNYSFVKNQELSIKSDEMVNIASYMRVNELPGFTFNYMNAKGTGESQTNLTAPNYSTRVLPDGSKVVNVYYTRNSYTLTITVTDPSTITSAKVTAGTASQTISKTTATTSISKTLTVRYDQNLTFLATFPANYKIKEWKSSDGLYQSTNDTYALNMPANNLEIILHTEENGGMAYFDPNYSGNPAPNPAHTQTATFTYGKAMGTLPNISRGHYIFIGWFTAKTGGTQITSSTVFTEADNGKTYYAHWATIDVLDANAHEHERTTVTEATCTTEGLVKIQCKVCGVSTTEVTPALGHIEGEPYVITVAKCYQEEVLGVNCTRETNGCGKGFVRQYATGKWGAHNTNSEAQCCSTHPLSWDGKYGCSGNSEAHNWGGGRKTLCGRDGKCGAMGNTSIWCATHGARARHTFHCARYGQTDKGKNTRKDGLGYAGYWDWIECPECSS